MANVRLMSIFISNFADSNLSNMKRQKNATALIFSVFAMVLTSSCNPSVTATQTEQVTQDSTVNAPDKIVDTTFADKDSDTTLAVYAVSTDNGITNATDNKKTQTKTNRTDTPSYGGKETLYISTYGANGKVWGHVTMNGKTGRGTIHDDDENSYSITVTRHGGELYGTDQNGRQYVFRL